MKNLYLIRHGESQRQAELSQDQVNSPLSDLGRRQAERLRGRFSGIPLDVLYISPLTRAVETATIARLPARRVLMDSRVIEVGQGPGFFGGLKVTVPPPEAEPDSHDAFLLDPYQRAGLFLEDVLASTATNLAVVGHQGIFRMIAEQFLGLPRQEKCIPLVTNNTGISRLQVNFKGQRLVRFWNDHTHVADLVGDTDPQI